MKRLLSLLLAIGIISISSACTCARSKPKETYCRSDWVAHTKILTSKVEKSLEGMDTVVHTVKYGEIFKSPNGIKLSTIITTSAFSPACGIELKTGNEYLLSGDIYNGTLRTSLCSQLIDHNANNTGFEMVYEWENVPTNLMEQLHNKVFEPCDIKAKTTAVPKTTKSPITPKQLPGKPLNVSKAQVPTPSPTTTVANP